MSLDKAIQNAQEGGYINAPISGTLKFCKEKQWPTGGASYTALLEDGAAKADITSKVDCLSQFAGKRVVIDPSGRGKGFYIKWSKTYNGKPQLSIGEAVKVRLDSDAQDASEHSAATQAYPSTGNTRKTEGNAVSGGPVGLGGVQMASIWADLIAKFDNALLAAGYEEQKQRIAIAARAPEFAALWWFGERTVKGYETVSVPPEVPAEAHAESFNDGEPPF